MFERTDSALLAASVTTVSLAPYIGIGPILTGWTSKFPRRRVLVGCDLVRAVAFGSMSLGLPIWTLLLLAFVAGTVTPPFEATRSAALPSVTDPENYGDALTLTSITAETALFAGYLLGGALLAIASASTALALDAATFLISAALLSTVVPERLGGAEVRTRLRDGFGATFGDRVVRRYVVLFTICAGCAMSGEALAPALVADDLHGQESLVGVLAALVSVGVIVSATLLPRRSSDTDRVQLGATVALIGSAGAALGFATGSDLPWVAVPYLCLGITFASRIPGNEVMGTRIPDHHRAAAFSVALGALALGQAATPFLAGLIARESSPRAALVVVSVVSVVAAAVAVARPVREPAEVRS